jgi:Ribosome biogenesis protein Nop16
MGRERQKKKSRSSIPKTRSTPHGRTKRGKKKVNFLGNAVIAENWYESEESSLSDSMKVKGWFWGGLMLM